MFVQNFLINGHKLLDETNLYIYLKNYIIVKGGDNMSEKIEKKFESNSRQIPSLSTITREKDYCDLLYAWLQCNSIRDNCKDESRKIEKSKIKWVGIEKDFTRVLSDGTTEKIMGRKTIAKYFKHLEEKGLIEYNTLSKLLNVFQKNSINIYIYLLNRYFANSRQPYIATIRQIKDFTGIATSTTSNNLIVDDTIDILKRLGLLDYELTREEDNKTYLKFNWVKNKLPNI